VRLVVVHASREALDIFARELGSVGLSCAPGTTGIYGGRPKPSPVVRLFTFYVKKSMLAAPTLRMGAEPPVPVPVPMDGGYTQPAAVAAGEEDVPGGPTMEVSLARLAYARSGDKAESAARSICRCCGGM
jgi:hypothetical protein